MSTTQRKRRGGAVNSRQARRRNRLMASTAEMASEAEPIELEESDSPPITDELVKKGTQVLLKHLNAWSDELRLTAAATTADGEVVGLASESSDPAVVDLTHNDSAVIVEENQQQSRNLGLIGQRYLSICILISTDEDEPRYNDAPSGTVSCPICMDGYSEIVQSGRLIVSTKCGHVFCSQCLRDSLRNANSCPTCRKKLTHRQYHPIYI